MHKKELVTRSIEGIRLGQTIYGSLVSFSSLLSLGVLLGRRLSRDPECAKTPSPKPNPRLGLRIQYSVLSIADPPRWNDGVDDRPMSTHLPPFFPSTSIIFHFYHRIMGELLPNIPRGLFFRIRLGVVNRMRALLKDQSRPCLWRDLLTEDSSPTRGGEDIPSRLSSALAMID